MALLIRPDGSTRTVLAEGSSFTLEEMYFLLDCSMIQPVYLEDDRIMVIDEEGKLKPHFVNSLATELLHKAGGLQADYIAGSALITEINEIQ